jgi:3-methyl-2-oxobutanoate hydroxymethyltransferase
MRLVEDALAVQESGAVMMILECMPTLVAKMITQHLSIPTIGIGAGVHCSGQVLVTPDAVGMYDRFVPKFCKQYAQITPTVVESLKAYNDEVKRSQFPTDANSYPMAEGEEEVFLRKFNQRYLNGGLEFAEL